MKVLVTGRQGQVVSSLLERAARRGDIEVMARGRPQLDLALPGTVRESILAERPDIVVSAAAYTAVDLAEDEAGAARTINRDGAGAVAAAAAELDVPVIHLSTDYVFAGAGSAPLTEDDGTDPQGIYGLTKLEGEAAVRAANPKHVILRTAWVYSPFGRNFVKTMLRLAGEREEIAVVADQWGNPTSALDIAEGILQVAALILRQPDASRFGIFHLAGSGSTNWSGLAEFIMQESRRRGGPAARIRPIATADYPTRARRPANSRLATGKLSAAYGWQAPDWRVSAAEVVARLVGPGA